MPPHRPPAPRLARTTAALAASLLAAAWVGAPDARADDAGYADAMAREHAGDRPEPTPAADAAPAAAVETRDVVYAHVDGAPVQGFLARPADAAKAPGLVVIHEWWGLNDNVRAMARRLAGRGYAALAVDLYGGRAATAPEAARALMQRAMARPQALRANLRQAHRFLVEEEGSPRVGTIGWCFGGGWSLDTALELGDAIDAAVVYYGRLETDPSRLARLRAPLLGIFGAEDRGIPLEDVRRFETRLRELGKTAEIHVYPGADHAFANPSGTRYRPDAAEDAWAKTLAFLAAHLER